MSAGFGGAGSVQVRGHVALRGNLKRGDRSSYPNLLEPLAFGVNSPQKSALSFGRRRSWERRAVFHLGFREELQFPSSARTPAWNCKDPPKKMEFQLHRPFPSAPRGNAGLCCTRTEGEVVNNIPGESRLGSSP